MTAGKDLQLYTDMNEQNIRGLLSVESRNKVNPGKRHSVLLVFISVLLIFDKLLYIDRDFVTIR